ncbi:MAG: poly-gamma-glutamate system protein [candidate division WOR-3 bacterium]
MAIIALFFIYCVFHYQTKIYAPHYQEKIASARLTQTFFEQVKIQRLKLGILIDPVNDPNQTGLIGIEHSPITSEPGDLNAKLTTTNPNVAGALVELLKKCQLKEGDIIAVSFSGSFPALNLATLATIQTLNLQPLIITSVSSSMWGANIPEFTYLDMENLLYQKGFLKFRSLAASIGGLDDIGRGLSPEGRNLIENAIKRNNITLLKSQNLEEAIDKKFKMYHEHAGNKEIACFINIGGGATALAGYELPTGILDPLKYSFHPGLAGKFLSKRIKVININNIHTLARRFNLPVGPVHQPLIGEGKLYYENRYSVVLSMVFLIILGWIIFIVLRIDIDYYLRRREND